VRDVDRGDINKEFERLQNRLEDNFRKWEKRFEPVSEAKRHTRPSLQITSLGLLATLPSLQVSMVDLLSSALHLLRSFIRLFKSYQPQQTHYTLPGVPLQLFGLLGRRSACPFLLFQR